MKEKEIFAIDTKGNKHKMVFNLNVMAIIQEKYETIEHWVDLIDKRDEEGNQLTPDLPALLFGFTEMLNEAIEIDNDENNQENSLINRKQAGRIIQSIGINNVMQKVQEVMTDSTKTDNVEKN